MKIYLDSLAKQQAFGKDKFLTTTLNKDKSVASITVKNELTVKNRFQKFFSTLFGTELRKISKVLNNTDGQKALSQLESTQLNQNLAQLNHKIAEINPRLLFGKIPIIQVPKPQKPISTTKLEFPQDLTPSDKLMLEFYRGAGKIHSGDSNGKQIRDVFNFDRKEKEEKHNFIQWLFPLKESSAFNPDVPLLNDPLILLMKKDPIVQKNLQGSLDSMLEFYWLKWKDGSRREIIQKEPFKERAVKSDEGWVSVNHHNFLRLSRMMKSLNLLGLENESLALRDCLMNIGKEYPQHIPKETLEYWEKSAI
jgi:hypothetical protein